MKKISLEDALHVAYESVGPNVLNIKSAVINLYSDIDGYFARRFGMKIGEEINEEEFQKVKLVFPRLSEMTLNQFNSLTRTFVEVRNVNAHLFLSRKVELDVDVEDCLNSIYFPLFAVTKDHCLTVYGQAYIAMFLCQKYNIWSFATSFFRKWFVEFDCFDGKGLSDYQIKFQHQYQEYCGNGKPVCNDSPLTKDVCGNVSQLFKSHMTEFVLSIERLIYSRKKASEYSVSFKTMVRRTFTYEEDNEAIDRLVLIRNCWLHGVNLYDKIKFKEQEICFDYQFMFESLIIIKRSMMRSRRDFTKAINILTNFGKSCFCFYALRLVEITYKLIDNRLLTQEKVDSRVAGSFNVYQNILNLQKDFLELAEELVESDEIAYEVKAPKFTDWQKRTTKCEKLRIVKLHSDNGFQIGNFKTKQANLALALIDLDEEFQNKVNGMYVKEYFNNVAKKIGNRIIIDEICLNEFHPQIMLDQRLENSINLL